MMEQNTATKPARERSIAEIIRHSRRPEGEMADLSKQAQRLYRSIGVAEQWIEATMKDVAPEMCSQAEMIHDQLEEELARVVYQMEDLARRREYKEMDREEVPEGVISNALLSDTLLEAYTVLSSAPEEVFGIGESEASARTRYKLMGALLTTQDAADAEPKRVEAAL